MKAVALPECSLQHAADEAPGVAARLLTLARQAEGAATGATVQTHRYWEAAARTYTYHTHARLPCTDAGRVAAVSDCFFHAAALPLQPWYTQFAGGTVEPVVPAGGAVRACLNVPRFDFGVGKLRSYRQLLTEFCPEPHTHVLVLRSVSAPVPFPPQTVPVYTLSPTGDVLRWADGYLHWHHICTVTGVGLLPLVLERPLMNLLRALRLDSAERRTYREEATGFIAWAQDAAAVEVCRRSIPPAG